MKKMKKRKGFTLTELAIVIAVIAILIAVLVPTFISLVNKARESSDSQLAKNMNNLLTLAEAEGNEPERMEDVNYILTEGGYTISKLSPTAEGNVFVWNYDTNRISYISEDGTVLYTEDSDLTTGGTFNGGNNYWLTVETTSEISTWASYKLSYYIASSNFSSATLTFSYAAGIDTGTYTVGTVKYSGSGTVEVAKTAVGGNNAKVAAKESTSSDKAIIMGTVTTLEVDKASISVVNYASITTATITTNATSTSYSESGYTKSLVVNSSSTTVEITNSGMVNSLSVSDSSTNITNSGYVKAVEGNASSSFSSLVTTSYTLNISSYSELANFRDKVNNGATYEGMTVNLTADIDLSGRTWVPIGYDSRNNTYDGSGSDTRTKKTNPSYYYFGGTFNGNNHTIKGLTNTGYTPTITREDTYGTGSTKLTDNYLYGLFGIINGAKIYDLKLTNVNIVEESIVTDSVGAIAGYACGSVVIDNCTVSGSIEGTDAVAGIVGRIFMLNGDTDVSVSISNCTNNATINSKTKAAGIVGYYYNYTDKSTNETTKNINGQITITNCTNNGDVSATSYAGGIMTVQQATTSSYIIVTNCKNNSTSTTVDIRDQSNS